MSFSAYIFFKLSNATNSYKVLVDPIALIIWKYDSLQGVQMWVYGEIKQLHYLSTLDQSSLKIQKSKVRLISATKTTTYLKVCERKRYTYYLIVKNHIHTNTTLRKIISYITRNKLSSILYTIAIHSFKSECIC